MAKSKKRPEKSDYDLIYIGLRKKYCYTEKTKNKMKKPCRGLKRFYLPLPKHVITIDSDPKILRY